MVRCGFVIGEAERAPLVGQLVSVCRRRCRRRLCRQLLSTSLNARDSDRRERAHEA